MKKILILWLLLVASAGAANLNIRAHIAQDWSWLSDIDSTRAIWRWQSALETCSLNAAGAGLFDTVITVDSLAEYEVQILWYDAGALIGSEDYNRWSYRPFATTDSVTVDLSNLGTVPANMTQIDGAATNGYNATLKLKQLYIYNSAGHAFVASTGDANSYGAYFNGGKYGIYSTGTEYGLYTYSTDLNGCGVRFRSGGGTGTSILLDAGLGRIAGYIDSTTKVIGISDTANQRLAAIASDSVWDDGYHPVANRTVTTNAFAANSITSAAINDGAITDAKVADDVKVAVNSVTDGAIQDKDFDISYYNDIYDGVWDEAQAGHTTNGTFGKFTDTTISSRATAAGSGITEEQMWAMLDSLSAGVLDVTATADVYPLLGGKFVVDAAGTNARTQFVVDTASLGACASQWQTLRNRSYILRSMGDSIVQIPMTLHSVAYTGANCTLTVADSVPYAFAAGDTIQMTAISAYEFASLAEAAAAASDSTVAKDTTGLRGDATVGGMIMTGGSSSSDTTDIKTMLDNNLFTQAKDTFNLVSTTTGNGRLPRYGDLGDSTWMTRQSVRRADSLGYLHATALAQNIGVNWGNVSNPSDTVDLTNTRMRAVDTAANAGSCAGSGIYVDTIYVRDTINSAFVVGANVTYDLGATNLYARTGSSGYAVFSMADTGTYSVSATDPPGNYTTKTIVLTASRRDTVFGGGVVTIAPSSPSMCSFQMSLDTASGFADAQVWFSLMPKKDDDFFIDSTSNAIMSPDIYTSANSSGTVQQDLNKNKNIKYFKSGEYGKTYWLIRVAKRGADLSSPDLKFIINTSDSTNYRVR